MPINALVHYLIAKFEHETIKDNYMADMARYAAWRSVKDGEKLPRYLDLKKPKDPVHTKMVEDEDVFKVFEDIANGEE